MSSEYGSIVGLFSFSAFFFERRCLCKCADVTFYGNYNKKHQLFLSHAFLIWWKRSTFIINSPTNSRKIANLFILLINFWRQTLAKYGFMCAHYAVVTISAVFGLQLVNKQPLFLHNQKHTHVLRTRKTLCCQRIYLTVKFTPICQTSILTNSWSGWLFNCLFSKLD